jgi:hypothetical protein
MPRNLAIAERGERPANSQLMPRHFLDERYGYSKSRLTQVTLGQAAFRGGI